MREFAVSDVGSGGVVIESLIDVHYLCYVKCS